MSRLYLIELANGWIDQLDIILQGLNLIESRTGPDRNNKLNVRAGRKEMIDVRFNVSSTDE